MKSNENKLTTVGCGILFAVVALGALVLVLRPFRGAVAQSLDIWPRAWWMVTNFKDEAAFPPKANVCAAPFCRRTDTERKYVGGNPGHMSESRLRFCRDHEPALPKTETRYDDALRFTYWVIAMGLSLLIGIAAPGIVLGSLMALESRVQHGAAGKVLKVLSAFSALAAAAVVVAWMAAWVMFAWW